MSTTPMYSSGQVQTVATNRWLWVAVGALAATTLAMGVAMVQMRSSSVPLAAPVAAPVVGVALPALSAPVAVPASAPLVAAAPLASTANEAGVAAKPTQPTSKKFAPKSATATPRTAPESVSKPAPLPAPMAQETPSVAIVSAPITPPPPPRVICAHCGTVTAVTPVEHDGSGSGAGAVAGALLGGLLGNQVGGGSGKTIATVIGAVGGGYAGNTVEKRMKKETAYSIDLRMEDGSTMRLEHASPLSVGAHVTVNNGVITP